MKIKPHSIFIYAAQSFFSSWAVMKAGHMEPGNIFTLIFFLLCFLFFRTADERAEKAGFFQNRAYTRTCAVISVLFSAFYMSVDYPRYIETLTNPLFRMGIIASTLCGYLFLFYYLLKFLFSFTADKNGAARILFSGGFPGPQGQIAVPGRLSKENPSPRTSLSQKLYSFYYKHTGLCAFLLCMLCWLPYFLYQYPGIMTPDSVNQFEQVLGLIPYSNHHPWVHTLLIGLIYHIGYRFTGSMLVALSLYTFFQMCLLAGSVCYFISTLRRFLVRPGVCFVVTLFYALIPYHAVFSVTIWKDIPFAAAVMLFVCSLFRLLFDKSPDFDKAPEKDSSGADSPGSKNLPALCVFTVTGLMLCLFRSNGWYAFLLCFPFLLFCFRKKAKTMFPALFGILLTAVIIKYPVMNAFHVTPPDFAESLSIPIQQITAVICNDRPLAEEELELIEKVVDLTYIKKLYDPHYADNIKNLVRAGNLDYLTEHKGEFLKLWAKLGLRYPGDYMTAYINQTYGYWYPDSFYLVAEAEGISATSLGVSHTPLIRGPLVVKAKEISIKLGGMVPLYGTLWSMGVACWVMIFCIGNVMIRKEKRKLILYLPGVAILLTVLIATPVATEFRYVYFMVFGMPFYLMSSVIPVRDREG